MPRQVQAGKGRAQRSGLGPPGNTPFTGGLIGGVGLCCVCRSLAHYVGCWRYHWDLFEYLLVSRKREYGGFLHTVWPGYILVLLIDLHDRRRDPGAASRSPQEEPDLNMGKQWLYSLVAWEQQWHRPAEQQLMMWPSG